MAMQRFLVVLAALALAACASAPNGPAPVRLGVRQVPLVAGYVRPPAHAAQRKLLSGSPDDIVTDAFVSLVDATGRVRATGLVEADGHFALMRSTDGFDPEGEGNEGQLFSIEAVNRHAEAGGGDWTSLRTRGYRQDGEWHSLSGTGPVIVSAQTSVVARALDADTSLTFSMGQSMLTAPGELQGLSGTPYDGTYTTAYLQRQQDLLVDSFENGFDPAVLNVYRPPSGQVLITRPQDFDAYRTCDAIAGTLVIQDDPGDGETITEIPLPRLQRVEGEGLRIQDCPGLASLAGLSRLQAVAGLRIVNTGLTSLAGLEGLQAVSAVAPQLRITGNAQLSDVGALSGLRAVQGASTGTPVPVEIGDNAALCGILVTALTDAWTAHSVSAAGYALDAHDNASCP